MSCIQEPVTRSYLGPAEYISHDYYYYIYLLQLFCPPDGSGRLTCTKVGKRQHKWSSWWRAVCRPKHV